MESTEKFTPHFTSLSCLLVEDEKINIIITTKVLERWGVEVHIAKNGIEGFELASQSSFDFILMDLQMPEMNGFECTKQIRSNKKSRNNFTPIFALTAYATEEAQRQSREVGMNYFMTKPLDLDVLARAIHRYCIELKAVS